MNPLLKKFFTLATAATLFSACAGDDIIPEIPLTKDPLVLANPISLVASAPRKRLYLANSNNRVAWETTSMVVFDLTDPVHPAVLAVFSIPNFSGQMFLDEARGYLYIPNRKSKYEGDETDQILRVNIEEASPDYLKVEQFESGEDPFGGFMNGDLLYVAATEEVLLYDVNDFTRYSRVDLNIRTNEGRDLKSEETRELALSPSGAHLFVTNRIDNMLILNTADILAPTAPGRNELESEAVDYIVTGTNSTRGVARGANFLYLVDGNPPTLKIMSDANLKPVVGDPVEITTASLQVASIPIGSNPGELLLDEARNRAYVSNADSDDVSVIDLALEKEIGRVDVLTLPNDGDLDDDDDRDEDEGDQPFGMALVELDGAQYLYVTHFQTNLVSIIRTDTLEVVGRFPQ